MSNPFIGEIRMFGGTFAPLGWAFCSGQLLSIASYDALFNLIGTTYGGDGVTTFALPDLRGRVPIHVGNGHILGEAAGVESVTLISTQVPTHTHTLVGSTDVATSAAPGGRVQATLPEVVSSAYGTDAPIVSMQPGGVAPVGGSQPHDNMQPSVCISFIIALEGIYPVPN